MSDSDSSSGSDRPEEDQGEDGNHGNRDNLVNTTCRLCTGNGYKRGVVFVDEEFHEVQLVSQPAKPRPESWVLDDSLDDVASPQKQRDWEKLRKSDAPPDSFATQSQTFDKLKEHCEKRFGLKSKAITVVALGGPGSGKSYTLFGGSNHASRGLAPRLFEYLFDDASCSFKASHVLLSTYALVGEHIVDLLTDPTVQHAHAGNLAYSKALCGPVPLPVQPVCVTSSKQAVTALSLALQTAGVLFATRAEYFLSASLVVSALCVGGATEGDARVVRISLVEAPAMACPPLLPQSIDRLAGSSLYYVSARALRSIGAAPPGKRKGVVGNTGGSNLPGSSGGTPAQRHLSEYSKSCLSYVLQDAVFKSPDVLLLGCLRGMHGSYEDNFSTLDLMNRIDTMNGDLDVVEDMTGLTLQETIAALDAEARECVSLTRQAREAEEHERNEAEARELGITVEALLKRKAKEKLAGAGEEGGGGNKKKKSKEGLDAEASGKRDKKNPPADVLLGSVSLSTAYANKLKFLYKMGDGLRCIARSMSEIRGAAAAPGRQEDGAVGGGGSKRSSDKSAAKAAAKAAEAAAAAAADVDAIFNARVPRELAFLPLEIDGGPQANDDEGKEGEDDEGKGTDEEGSKKKEDRKKKVATAAQQQQQKPERRKREALVGAARWQDPQANTDYVNNAATFLRLHGLEVAYVDKPKLLQGEEFKAAKSAMLALKARLAECELVEQGSGNGETLAVTFSTPWANECESLDPYMLLLSPASGLAEHFSKVPLPLGQVLVRGQTLAPTQVAALEQQQGGVGHLDGAGGGGGGTFPRVLRSDNATLVTGETTVEGAGDRRIPTYSFSPVDKDAQKDAEAFKAALEVCTNNDLFPPAQVRRDKQRAAKDAATRPSYKQISIPGPGVQVLHAVFSTVSQNAVRVRPAFFFNIGGDRVFARVRVNGQDVFDEVALQDQDVVQLGSARFVQIRIPSQPLHMKKTGGALGDEKRSDLTLWEWSMLKAFGRELRNSCLEAERTRRHIAHMAEVNREVAAVTKTRDKTALMKMTNFDPPTQIVAAVYASISAIDRAYLCCLIGCAELVTLWGEGMRRRVRVSFRLQALSEKDVTGKGKAMRVSAAIIAAATAAAATVGEEALEEQGKDRKQYKNDFERRQAEEGEEEEKDKEKDDNDEEEEEGLQVSDVAAPHGRRRAMMRTIRVAHDGSEATVEDRLYCGQILCEEQGDASKWWWAAPCLLERFGLIQAMQQRFCSAWCGRDTTFLDQVYPPPDLDPFQDTADDEFIGCGYLYLDGLQFLLDLDDLVPITSLGGHRAGAVRVRCRAWIEKVETAPPYLSVDRERTLEEFVGKTLILRFYFEQLQDLPPNLCASSYVKFKFFYHTKTYKTPRHGGAGTCPYLHSTMQISQKITMDFIEYVRRASLEIEVFGKRRPPLGEWGGAGAVHSDWPLHVGEFVEPYVPPPAPEGQPQEEGEQDEDNEGEVETLKRELEDLQAEFTANERQLIRAAKVSEAEQEAKNDLQKRLEKTDKKLQEMKLLLANTQEKLRGREEATAAAPKKQRSGACVVA